MSPETQHPLPPDIAALYVLRHFRFVATVAITAAGVVALDSPGRLDLWTAEFLGTAIIIAAGPLLLMRMLRTRASLPILLLTVVLGIALAQAKHPGQREAHPEAADSSPRALRDERLPTASDGFGGYARPPAHHSRS
jgi:hypothetical protein